MHVERTRSVPRRETVRTSRLKVNKRSIREMPVQIYKV